MGFGLGRGTAWARLFCNSMLLLSGSGTGKTLIAEIGHSSPRIDSMDRISAQCTIQTGGFSTWGDSRCF